MAADDFMAHTLSAAWSWLRAELRVVDAQTINESVFRYFFVRSIPLAEGLRYETEWHNRVDLYVRSPTFSVAIEFKFYAIRTHSRPDASGARKGGPSKRNEAEFAASWQKLATICSEHTERPSAYVVLVYQAADEDRARRTFHASYGALGVGSLPHGCLARQIHRLDPIEWKPGHRMHAVLFCLD